MSDLSQLQQQQQQHQPNAPSYSIVSGPVRHDEDFLSQHLGQLLVRQPISPRASVVTASPGTHDGASVGSLCSAVTSSSCKDSRASIHDTPNKSRAMVSSNSRHSLNSVAGTLPPACDDLFTSFFAPSALNRRSSQARRDGASTSSLSSESRCATSQGSESVSMSTSFGVRHKSIKRGSSSAKAVSGAGSDKVETPSSSASCTTEQSSLFMPSYRPHYQARPSAQQQLRQQPEAHRNVSHASSRSHSQPSSVETAPTTPPASTRGSDSVDPNKLKARWTGTDGLLRRTSSGATSPGSDEVVAKNRATATGEDAPTTINAAADVAHPLTANEQLDEERKLKNFREGGVVEPPEMAEGSCIQRSDMRKGKGGGRHVVCSSSSSSSGAKASRHASMVTSAYHPDYFSSAYLKARDSGGEKGSNSLHSSRKGTTSSGTTSKVRSVTSSSGRKAVRPVAPAPLPEVQQALDDAQQLALPAVKLVPLGDDGRSFRFVSRASLQDEGLVRSNGAGSGGGGINFKAISARAKSLA